VPAQDPTRRRIASRRHALMTSGGRSLARLNWFSPQAKPGSVSGDSNRLRHENGIRLAGHQVPNKACEARRRTGASPRTRVQKRSC